ncbi:MAG: leucine-rich repeat domain-containing protein, partial [Pirellulales bacterium]
AAVGAISIGPVGPVALIGTILSVSAAVAGGSFLLAKFFLANGDLGRWQRIARHVGLPTITLSAAMASIPVGITLESVAWLRRVDGGNQPDLRRLGLRCFTRGLCQFDTWNASPEFRSSDLRKLRRFDGIRYFRLNRGDFDDDSLALVSEWPSLKLLDWNSIADGRTRRTGGLPWLTAVDLIHTRVTGATFAKLSPSLTDLWLIGTPLTDESLKHLSQLSALESLYLGETKISDTGVANLAGVSALRILDLSGTQVTDPALASLARNNRSLASLELRDTSVTRKGLAHIADLPKLTILDLRDCRLIDDDAIQALTRCRSLGLIGLSGTKVTRAGVTRLRAAMSWCMFEYSPEQSRRD